MITNFNTAEHGFLSNFWYVDILYKGVVYPTVEHAYMSAKSDDPKWKEFCANRNITPSNVKKESKNIQLVAGWDKLKLEVMEDCLRYKYKEEPLRSKLINLGNQNIQEGNTWGDRFWGVDLKVNPNIGENHLGRLIMKIREQLIAK